MKISIAKKDQRLIYENLEECKTIDKRKYLSIILTLKVIVALLYAFGLGYSLFFFGDDFIKVGVLFLPLLVICYILIEFPYSIIKSLLLPKVFKKNAISLYINPFTMAIDITSSIKISKIRFILSIIISVIIFAVVPTIVSYLLEFNIYLYAIASSSAIIATKDIFYLFLILKNYSYGKTFKLGYNEFIFFNN